MSLSRSTRTKRWIPPPQGFAKINVDGSFFFLQINVDGSVTRNQEKEAFAAVCRDEKGNYLGASTMVLRSLIESEILEDMACNEGLNIAADLTSKKYKPLLIVFRQLIICRRTTEVLVR